MVSRALGFVEICASCREPWTQDESGEYDIPRDGKQRASSGSIESRVIRDMDEFIALESIMAHRPRNWQSARWAFACQAWRVYLHSRVGSFHAAAEYARELRSPPDHIEWWSRDAIRRWVTRAKIIIDQRSRRDPNCLYLQPLRRVRAPMR